MPPLPAIRLCFICSRFLAVIALVVVQGCSWHRPERPRTAVSIEGDRWLINDQVILPGSPAEGLLMNVRMVNTVLEDVGPQASQHLPGFDPDENTRRFIASLPAYHAAGVRAFTVSLQGGHAGYEQVMNSAFNADGSLRPGYMERVARVIEACDRLGMVVILTAFYQRQHWHERAVAGKAALLAAVGNMARWVDEAGYTNVVLEISNEYSHGGFRNWADGEWLRSPAGQVELIRHARAVAPRLLVSTSDGGHGRMHESIAAAADFILIHFNNTGLEDIPARIQAVRAHGKPVLCNEDDKVGHAGAEALRLSVQHGAGWGMMHSRINQDAPFAYNGPADDPVVYDLMRRLTTPGETVPDLVSEGTVAIITQPNDGAVFKAGAHVTVRASIFGEEAESIREVRFLADGREVGRRTGSPWSIRWDNVPAGAHNLTAVVIDRSGNAVARSRPVDIHATPSSPY